ncbi:MAG: class I SAM-dependent rRNA methyltransferase [Solobacterium sp.]|jgi:23S rRNA (cytosine1962-C5)-methyltransferase|nr:class I SAM-dependent rRNA methyltransferase [Solobacterium sp.]MCH4223311.1 class I SAM-dependent rRNA methyltransferase [Solobacterium sp.]
MTEQNRYPEVVISKQGEEFLERGQNWMYQNNLVHADDECTDGGIVTLVDEQKHYIGTGFYSPVSHITVRLLTRNKEDVIDSAFFQRRIQSACEFRKTTNFDNLSNCRLIFGEADLLPGLTVDRYNDILVSQISCNGMEQIKDEIYSQLLEVLKKDGQDIKGIYERNDIKVRDKEGLKEYKGFWKNADLPTQLIINENGIRLNVDIENGQKTGYFLDQKSNRVLLRNMAHGKTVLDCFTHTGGFALNAAYGNASAVTAVDVSETALEEGRKNAELNHLEDRIQFVQADVFEYLDQCKEGQFDIIVLDPPAFTKSRRTIDHAYQGYKRINEKAMGLLKNGGYLITCSCSRFMEIPMFEQMLKDSAQSSGVLLKQVSVTQQNSDHPILWTMDETSYLKFYIFQILKA